MELCFLFFVVVEAVTFLDDAMFSLVLLLGLVWLFLRSVLIFWAHREEFGWLLRGGGGGDYQEDP